ncbi:aldo/keto reductase [Niabella aurantiaca]|uniref:aldo/keto reductase n=1 Tax=Niabella aurantiaca TaxID=379900 RepID=UPI00035DE030|nr:aldo/keto reductase [Niabella aurantiaca]
MEASAFNKTIGPIGLGCVTFGREIDREAAFRLMDFSFKQGIRFFDTAASYGEGRSEAIIGNWMARNPEYKGKTMVATKLKPPYEPTQMLRCLDESLEHLGMETIDLLYLHCWDGRAENLQTLKCLEGFIRTGKVRSLGASNFNALQLGKVLQLQLENGWTPFSFAQNNHNLAVSDMSREWLQLCRQYRLRVIGYSPLGAGFLTGKYLHGVMNGTRFDIIKGHQAIYFNERSQRRLKRLQELAAQTGLSPELLAMAWAVHQKEVDCVLVGGRTVAHIDNALQALQFTDSDLLSGLECD